MGSNSDVAGARSALPEPRPGINQASSFSQIRSRIPTSQKRKAASRGRVAVKGARRAQALLGVSLVLTTVTASVGGAYANFSATTVNAGNSVGTGTQFMTATGSGNAVQCTSVPAGTVVPAATTFDCSGSLLAAQLPATGQIYGSVKLTATGTNPGRSMKYTALSCGPVQLANSAMPGNPLLPRFGVSYQTAGPTNLAGSTSTSLNGSMGVAKAAKLELSPQVYSVAIWFKTSQPGTGLISLSNSPTTALPNLHDRTLEIDSTGRVNFFTWAGQASNLQSPTIYTDNAWHFAVATFDASTGTTTQSLYVDGQRVATASYPTNTTNAVYNGYWGMGQSYHFSPSYFSGLLSNASVFPSVLTATKILNLYTTTSQTAYATAVNAESPTNYWPLTDDGMQSFSGPYPVIGTDSPCAHVLVVVETTECIYPTVHAGVCGGYTAGKTLQTLATAGPQTVTTPVIGSPQILNTYISRNNTFSTYDEGLQLVMPVSITVNGFTQTFTWLNNRTIL